jgi:hypothetical protein
MKLWNKLRSTLNVDPGKLTSKFATTIFIGFMSCTTSHNNISLCYTVLHIHEQQQQQQQPQPQ